MQKITWLRMLTLSTNCNGDDCDDDEEEKEVTARAMMMLVTQLTRKIIMTKRMMVGMPLCSIRSVTLFVMLLGTA